MKKRILISVIPALIGLKLALDKKSPVPSPLVAFQPAEFLSPPKATSLAVDPAAAAPTLPDETWSEILLRYHSSSQTAFFDPDSFIEELSEQRLDVVEELEKTLVTVPQQGMGTVADVENPPAEVLERMAAIDLLGDLATSDTHVFGVTQSLERILLAPWPEDATPSVKRLLLRERKEVLELLALVNPGGAEAVLSEVSHPVLRDKLQQSVQREVAARSPVHP